MPASHVHRVYLILVLDSSPCRLAAEQAAGSAAWRSLSVQRLLKAKPVWDTQKADRVCRHFQFFSLSCLLGDWKWRRFWTGGRPAILNCFCLRSSGASQRHVSLIPSVRTHTPRSNDIPVTGHSVRVDDVRRQQIAPKIFGPLYIQGNASRRTVRVITTLFNIECLVVCMQNRYR